MTYINMDGDEGILRSHHLTISAEVQMMWGEKFKDYEVWKAQKSEEELQQYINQGFNSKGIDFLIDGDIKKLMPDLFKKQ